MKKALIFDLDGTLWDSGQAVAEAWNLFFEKNGWSRRFTKEDMHALMGLPMDAIRDVMFPNMDPKEAAARMQACERFENEYIEKHGGQLYPDVPRILEELSREYMLLIVSNCQKGYIEAFLKAHGLESLFTDTECYGNTLLYKDENIRRILERHLTDQAVYIGDTLMDKEASQKAGIPFLWAAYGFGQNVGLPKAETFSQIPSVLETMFNS